MYQTEYLELAIELYGIYSDNKVHHKRWLTIKELEKCKRGPGFIFKVKRMKGRMSALQPVFVDYVNSMTEYHSCNTPKQWACKFDKWLFNEYEFTPQEVNELQADGRGQVRRETSQEVTN
jgi:hypothetical protein